KLEGFDNGWHDVGGRRQAVYTNLPLKRFTFRVIACNNDGAWNDAGALLDFSIQRAYYQSPWFTASCFCAFATLLSSLHRLRLMHRDEQLNVRYRERLAERTRIARESHDTLLQNLCGFALQLDALSKHVLIPDAVRERLREIRQDSEQCQREARE